tara:strand:+ start:1550 stop:1702 length:153 start_codon:yes stop_codon:yes gene_type:complete
MTVGGWIIMIVSVGSVTCLFSWCIHRVLTTSEEEEDNVHGTEIETPDTKN